jgi:hypothetical protein
MRWFKLSNDLCNDFKVSRLPDKLFRTWIFLLCLASKNEGILPSMADICFYLRLSTKEAQARLNDLTYRGLLDHDAIRRTYTPHNWEKWQYHTDTKDPTSAERQRRYRDKERDRKRNAYRNGQDDVTGP